MANVINKTQFEKYYREFKVILLNQNLLSDFKTFENYNNQNLHDDIFEILKKHQVYE